MDQEGKEFAEESEQGWQGTPQDEFPPSVSLDHTSEISRPRPTMQDVARSAGVSLKTVSRVVNNEPRVDEKTKERVNEAIARLAFRRNDLARSLRRG